MKGKRAVSPIIATILLVAVAAFLIAVLYVLVSNITLASGPGSYVLTANLGINESTGIATATVSGTAWLTGVGDAGPVNLTAVCLNLNGTVTCTHPPLNTGAYSVAFTGPEPKGAAWYAYAWVNGTVPGHKAGTTFDVTAQSNVVWTVTYGQAETGPQLGAKTAARGGGE